MRLGMIGLGKMGYNLVLNLMDHKHEAVVYDVHAESRQRLSEEGAIPASSFSEMVKHLPTPRVIWLMVPAGEIVDQVIDEIAPYLEKDDILIDGGNSHYKDTLARAEKLKAFHIHYVDVGTSGGVSGARSGGCFMIGADPEVFQHIEPVFQDISVENGYMYTGEVGSGHFLKMVHNGIEYGMMQAIAEGFEVLDKSPFDYNYKDVAHVWSHGSVVRGWLMELLENAFDQDPKLEEIRGVMHSSGEGQWTVETALELKANTPVIATSLFMRYRSLEDDTFHGKIVAALRNQFGGHEVVKKEE